MRRGEREREDGAEMREGGAVGEKTVVTSAAMHHEITDEPIL